MDFDVEYERYVPKSFPKDLIQQAVNYKPMDNDVFIVSYPKCGTTWTQQILYLLLNDGVPPNKTILFSKSIPFLELCAPEAPRDRDRHLIRGFKTHLPSHLAPYDKCAKYIYCDFPLLPCHDFNGFFKLFMSGQTGYGDYFDHLMGWYERHRHSDNVLIVHFEDLKADLEAEVKRIARFISDDSYERLVSHKTFAENVLKFSTFDFMKTSTNEHMKQFFEMSVNDMERDDQILDGFKDAFRGIKTEKTVNIAPEVNHIRKGIVGDFRTHFTAQQNKAMNDKI
ncbi:unnamed protein product [Oppiella nova]|uniref:Sulfotransferase domain-containing protein n=1 Tax=Oppiella nova TaxID=334625 RepID=A0A7R9QVE9_9ACAR|nr:unnamed protein product [Oppiella nova]CAG2175816.1 unnamed protein product [Oppiella nova]